MPSAVGERCCLALWSCACGARPDGWGVLPRRGAGSGCRGCRGAIRGALGRVVRLSWSGGCCRPRRQWSCCDGSVGHRRLRGIVGNGGHGCGVGADGPRVKESGTEWMVRDCVSGACVRCARGVGADARLVTASDVFAAVGYVFDVGYGIRLAGSALLSGWRSSRSRVKRPRPVSDSTCRADCSTSRLLRIWDAEECRPLPDSVSGCSWAVRTYAGGVDGQNRCSSLRHIHHHVGFGFPYLEQQQLDRILRIHGGRGRIMIEYCEIPIINCG
jgi:hypothetical protein